jgi:hypothetical protein
MASLTRRLAPLQSIQIFSGSTAISTAGTSITPVNVNAHTGMSTAGTSVTGPSTTLSSTTSATVRFSDVWNVAAQYRYTPIVDLATIKWPRRPSSRSRFEKWGLADMPPLLGIVGTIASAPVAGIGGIKEPGWRFSAR